MAIPSLAANATRTATPSESSDQPLASIRLAAQVLSTSSSSRVFTQTHPALTRLDNNTVEIPLYYPAAKREGDRIDSVDALSEAWAAAYEQLTTQPLSEREILQLLKSGFPCTVFGKKLKQEFIEAFMRSTRPLGDLTPQRLREIVEVLFDLPPHDWASVLGERLNFAQGHSMVADFIQARLTLSRQQRDEQIARHQLLTNAQWQCLREIIEESPPWVYEAWAQRLDLELERQPAGQSWVDLEDVSHVRPSPAAAQFLLSQCRQVINGNTTNEAVSSEYETRIHQLLNGILEKTDPAVADRTVEETLSFEFLKPFRPHNHLVSYNQGPNAPEREFPLLAVLEEIERKGEFYDFVTRSGPSVPLGLVKRLLYVLNLNDQLNKLPGRAGEPGPQALPGATTPIVLEQMLREADALLTTITHSMTGWRPVEAALPDPRNIIDRIIGSGVRTPLRQGPPANSYGASGNPYAETTEPVNTPGGSLATLEELASQLGAWLNSAAGYLGATGATVITGAAGFAQRHPRASASVMWAAIYAAVNAFHSRWFADPAPALARHFAPETDPGLRRTMVEGVESFLERVPEVAKAVQARIANSTHADPHLDQQLVPDVVLLLEQPVPWSPHITSAALLDEIISAGHEPPERSDRRKRAAQWTLETLNDADATSSADRDLCDSVIALLDANHNVPLSIPEDTLIHEPVERYKNALNDTGLFDFFTVQGLDPSTLRIHHDCVTGLVTRDGIATTETFTLWDNSGWWQVSQQLLPILQVLDPDDSGLCHVNDESNAIPPDVVLAFYGVNPPTSEAEAKNLASELKASGWPEFTTGKKARLEKALERVELAAEEAEARAALVHALEHSVKDKPDNATLALADVAAAGVSRSLAQESQAIRQHLNDFLALPAMIDLCQAKHIDCREMPVRVSERKIQVLHETQWVDLTGAVNAQPALKLQLDTLIQQTEKTGHSLYSRESFDLLQVIRFKGFDAPRNAGEVRNIIRWLKTALPPSPPLGNYAVDLLAGDAASVALSKVARTALVDASKALLNGAPSIIDALGAELLGDTSLEDRRTQADTLVGQMLDTDQSDAWGQTLVEKLDWFGAAEGQTASVRHYQQLLLTAIKLNIDPEASGKSGSVAGYDVYQPKNMGRDAAAIRSDIEAHLIDNKGVSELAAPLVAHLFLADAAPELLVHQVGKGVVMGSAGWMTLRLGVDIAEASHPGCSRGMTDEQLMAIAVLDPVTEENRLLFQSLGVDITVAWGVMNGLIRQRPSSSYSPGDYEHAANLLARQRAELAKAFQAITQPLQTRRELAIIELRKVFPATSVADIEALQLWSKNLPATLNLEALEGRIHGLIEVYMAGDLTAGDWWIPSKGINAEQLNQKIRQLPDLNNVLTASVDRYFSEFQQGFLAPAKLLFSELPLQDRQCLELGTVELFTLREETGSLKEDETPQLRDSFRGHFGTLIRCEHAGDVSYFEVFLAQMKIIKRTDLPRTLPLDGEIKVEKARVSKGSAVNVDVQRGTSLPFDFKAYSTGTDPTANTHSPRLIIERLGGSLPGTALVGADDPGTYVPNSYFSSKVAKIAERVINDNLLQGQKAFFHAAAKGETPREKQVAFWQKIGDFLLRLIPFVGCVSDLRDGTRMGLINGSIGCVTDAVSSLFGLVGGAGKTIGAVRTIAPIKVKAFEVLKITTGSVASVINPLSGIPDLIIGTARGVRRFAHLITSGVFEVTQNGLGRLQNGLEQVRSFFGGLPVALAGQKLPGWMDAEHAILKGVRLGSNATAIQANGKWYGVDRQGHPSGPPLVGFTPLNPAQRV
ncbi:hypothetical protein NTD84_14250 [Pseudomonas sp. 14P_8.1_Bac3]|uniref:hypothetical protein n=1 Tax=Pseudomonas sp. 14P_8.1_Bac3 TaxID=2971621 RepID=UPI0021C96C2F|nr:hypothetical protein [Pseudomonas sp. 14P_8.1_Bac3]MCU1760872.1 hypothetical protein [Pseudomonas sp. 14P_8.1_Bac3]